MRFLLSPGAGSKERVTPGLQVVTDPDPKVDLCVGVRTGKPRGDP